MAAASRRIVGVSTKLYFSAARTAEYVSTLLSELQGKEALLERADVFVIPDHLTIMQTVDRLKGTGIITGAQDTFYEDGGAYTGEASPAVLAEVGVRIVEIGHAERRRLFGETDADTAKKAAAAVRNGITPLVCIGEKQRSQTTTLAVEACEVQVKAVVSAVPDDADMILAYEPVWAIGAAAPAEAEYVVSVTKSIKALPCVAQRKGQTRILYGGSAGPGLFRHLQDGVDGLFLGRFAHDPKNFVKTIEEIVEA